MGIAPLVAEILARQQVQVTFFAANEKTQQGDGSLGEYWAPWWRARAIEGHAFASHTFNHVYWLADLGASSFKVKPSAGMRQGESFVMDSAGYCEELGQVSRRLEAITGQKTLPLFRAPGGKLSSALETAAQSCGYTHVGWSPAGFLGDELPSEKFSNAKLLEQALRSIRSGDILMAHLGIWSRKDPWAPAVLEPLIIGLKVKGFCFRTLRDHPQLGALGRS
jgi:peptidoglycan/xylan/chitin deacetylase (PgdA/CDA1 family)